MRRIEIFQYLSLVRYRGLTSIFKRFNDLDISVILEHMGDIYRQLDESEQALILYEKALEKDANNKLIKNKINQLYGR